MAEYGEPRGGFTREVACPFCGRLALGNVPGTPERKIVQGYIKSYEEGVYSTNKCPNSGCGKAFFTHRYSDGSWVVRKDNDAPRKV